MANDRELAARLKAFALILKFGHDLFAAKNFDDAAMLAVNNSCSLLNFKTATLVELFDSTGHVIAQFGQTQVNPHSRLAVLQRQLCEGLSFDGSEPLVIGRENGLAPELAQEDNIYFAIKIPAPGHSDGAGFTFIWLLEYHHEIPSYTANAAQLMANSIGEALYYHRLCKNQRWHVGHHVKKRRILLVILLLCIAAMFIRTPERTTAEFTLKAQEITAGYAWFDGTIAKCLKQDGEVIRQGEVIAEYDTKPLTFRLAGAASALQELQTELELEEQNAFSDQSRLGRAKLLEARLASARVSVTEAQWYLDHSRIVAPADGILALTDGRAEQLAGKAVRTGDKLFDIYGGTGMVAEIPINERDASVMRKYPRVTLFLHTEPETPIPAKVIEIAQYPELTEQRTYCYKIRVELPPEKIGLRYGMRGIAKLSGEKVTLAYHLFKSVVLYFRGL